MCHAKISFFPDRGGRNATETVPGYNFLLSYTFQYLGVTHKSTRAPSAVLHGGSDYVQQQVGRDPSALVYGTLVTDGKM